MEVSMICCVCQRKKSLSGWVDQFINQYETISHGYCPECFHKTMLKFGIDPELDNYGVPRKKERMYYSS